MPGISSSGGTDLDALSSALLPLFAPGSQQGTVGSPVTPVTVNAFTASSSPAVSYSATGLPAGLSIDASSGRISGTPAAPGTYPATVTGTAGPATGSVSLTWSVRSAVTVTSPGTLSTVAGTRVDLQSHAVDSTAGQTLSYSAKDLPAGLSMSSQGLITGWPSSPAGTHKVTITAADGLTGSGSVSFTWAVTAAPGTGPSGAVPLDLAGKCLDDAGNSSANGTKVETWSCGGGAAQQWTIAADRTLRIHGKCLSVAGSATAAGSKVVLEACSGGAGQQWRVGTTAELVNPAAALCLSDPASSKANGAAVEILSCAGTANQKWTLPAGRVTSQVGSPAVPVKCLTDASSGTANGTAIDLWSCGGGGAQNWIAEPDGTMRVEGKCLNVTAAPSGSPLDLYTCNGTAAQQWTVSGDGAGVMLQNPQSGLCLTDPKNATANTTRLVTGACTAGIPGVTWRIH